MHRIYVIARTTCLETIRRKDMYVLLILLAVLLYTLLTVNVFGLDTTIRYVLDLGLLMAWIFSLILAINVGCRQLPTEETKGTIYPLLAKPVTRGELIIGKWLGSSLIVAFATALFYLIIAAVGKLRGGDFQMTTFLQALVLQLVGVTALVALGEALSTRMTYGSAATMCYVILGASLVIIPRVPNMLLNETGARATLMLVIYYLFPHFELFDMRLRVVHEWGSIGVYPMGILIAYGAVLTALLLLLAWLGYRTKRFSRGAVF
jgi:ABC-type transport system involved in multi-copper enzyme maturation permease subunit